jgi:hypothetical protein
MSVKLAEIDVTVARKHATIPQMMLKAAEIDVTTAQRNVNASEKGLRVFENSVTIARGSVTPSQETQTSIGNSLPLAPICDACCFLAGVCNDNCSAGIVGLLKLYSGIIGINARVTNAR